MSKDIVVDRKSPTIVNQIGNIVITFDASRPGADGLELYENQTCLIPRTQIGDGATIDARVIAAARALFTDAEGDRVTLFGGVTHQEVPEE
jgi:hypothetical protein